LLALVNGEACRLLDDPVLLRELSRLERRAGSGGRDTIGHPPRGHDDVAAAAAFALTRVQRQAQVGELELVVAGGGATHGDPLFDEIYRRELAELEAEAH
jgi:hypothetical protein